MILYWNGVDISEAVDILECSHIDRASDGSDCLDIVLDHAGKWYKWQPRRGDRVRAELNGYSTGDLYLEAVLPNAGKYRVLATGIPCIGKRKANKSYRNRTLAEIMEDCAAECGMRWALFGLDGQWKYGYMTRNGEGCSAFLSRLAACEGAVLKAVNGKLQLIGIEWAQNRPPVLTMELKAEQKGAEYSRIGGEKLSRLTLKTPYAEAYADDTATSGAAETENGLCPADRLTAGRWARGLLLNRNRAAEELRVKTVFQPNIGALERVDITGGTDADGEWLVEEAAHDLQGKETAMKLFRVIRTIR